MGRGKSNSTTINNEGNSRIIGAVKSIEAHPIKELFNYGINISINTDDLLLFNHSVSEEFLYVYNAGLLGVDELNEIRLNGLK